MARVVGCFKRHAPDTYSECYRLVLPLRTALRLFQRRRSRAYNVLADVRKEEDVRSFSRRAFMKQAGMCLALSELLLSGEKMVHAIPLGLPIGCQTKPVRSMIEKDFPGILKQLAAAGFQSIEMCSRVGCADSGFGGLRM